MFIHTYHTSGNVCIYVSVCSAWHVRESRCQGTHTAVMFDQNSSNESIGGGGGGGGRGTGP